MPIGEQESFYERVTEEAKGRTVTLVLQSGDERAAANVRVAPDSVRWLVPDIWSRRFTQARAIPTSEVKEIIIRDPVKGGLLGAALGAVGGMAFATVPASTQKQRDAGRILLIGSLFSAMGAGGGAFAGARKAERDIYIFSEYLEGSDRYLITRLLEGKGPGVADLVDQLRTSIRNIDNSKIEEQITETNIVYLSDDQQFCYLVADDAVVRVYLSAKPTDMDDPMGLVRPWSTGDSWFTIIPGGDIEYAKLLISQVYRHIQ